MLVTRLHSLVAGSVSLMALSVLPGGCEQGTLDSAALSSLTAGAVATSDEEAVTEGVAEPAGASEAEAPAGCDHMPPPGPPGGPPLTEEQRVALEELVESYNAGELTQDEFCQAMHELLGDPPCGPPLPPIALTDEQLAAAESIFQQAHAEFIALHAAARDEVLAQLTAEQQEQLSALEAELAPPQEPDAELGPLCPPPARVPLPPCPQLADRPALPPGEAAPGMRPPHGPPPGGPRHAGPPGPPPLCLESEEVATLALTDEQTAAITAIHEALRTALDEARAAADESFRALLTAEQLAKLDQLPPPPPRHGPPR